ncbi:GMC family oxidoreductase N-terminal domain-containing protein [Yinghuangia sp. ASG 101]|uniref:GMC family oxidoreductase n=1 Tax=Yinghuangia sp. ASG 101 TaxID=2896848 RepID=UPI001E44E7D6|nr:GMC family oxidoreductase N-terminal domain-containing protein [Yinghuangia sp. ASG 101]UGQ13399.1 GMC family oxidoreductase N-terminal domain-containing protein [Yinghuangia sp. ASG 101]
MTATDYVVVGAGVAGSLVAARLSARTGASVLLLEAGGRLPDGPPTRDPDRAAELWGTDADWADTTVPQPGLGGRTVPWPSGRALGGSSAVNAALWVRGNPADYDAWGVYGGPTWNRRTALSAFARLERDDRAPAPRGGAHGPLLLESAAPDAWSAALTAAAHDLGFASTDVNGPRQEGVDTVRRTTRGGRRVTFADAFLAADAPVPHPVDDPRDDRPPASADTRTDTRTDPRAAAPRIVTGATVTGIVVEAGRALGVTYRRADGPELRAVARREVLLAAGAVRTAHLLLLSGIGPRGDLAAHGIRPVADLPGVGRDLRDHVALGGAVPAPDAAPPLPDGGGAVVVFARADGRPGVPDLEIVLAPGVPGPDGGPSAPGVRFGVVALQPRSRGTVRLADADPFTPPLIDPGYLTDPTDADAAALTAGWELARRLLATKAAASVAKAPPPPRDTATVRRTAGPMFHPVGTARFGPDDDDRAVLDGALRVRGVAGLRVVDAAAIPVPTRGHTMSATAVIADRAVDLVAAAHRGTAH